jgi:hypothetical protein
MRFVLTTAAVGLLTAAFTWYRANRPAGSSPESAPSDRATNAITRSIRMLPVALGIAAQFPSPLIVIAPVVACAPAGLALFRFVAVERRSRVAAATAPLLFLSLATAMWVTAMRETVAVFGWLAWGGAVLVLVSAIATIRPSTERMTAAVVDGVGWYLVTAVVLHVGMGLESRIAPFRPKTATIFGTQRVLWPLSSSAQEPPIMAALYLVSNAATRRLPGRATAPTRACFLAAVITVWIFGDDRFAVIASIAIVLAATRFSARRVRATGAVCAVLLCMPWWWGATTGVVSIVSRDMTVLSRSGNASDLLTLNNRSNVWKASRSVLEQKLGRHTLVGYGLRGQRTSGASARYASYFGSYADPQAASTHNSLLQLLLDQGLIGAGVEASAIVLAFRALGRRARARPGDVAGHGLLRIIGLLLAASAAEAVLSASFAQLPFWLLVIVLAIAVTDDATAAPARVVDVSEPAWVHTP